MDQTTFPLSANTLRPRQRESVLSYRLSPGCGKLCGNPWSPRTLQREADLDPVPSKMSRVYKELNDIFIFQWSTCLDVTA
jgi:hypothetical protein